MPTLEELRQKHYANQDQQDTAEQPTTPAPSRPSLDDLWKKHKGNGDADVATTEPADKLPPLEVKGIDWGRAIGNIPKDAIQNIVDLKHLFTKEGIVGVGKFLDEITSVTRWGSGKKEFPVLNSIKGFYAQNYDIRSAEGRDRFYRYVEEHPAQFASDLVGLASTLFAPGLGAGIKVPVASNLASKLNASKHLAAKAVRGSARLGEAVVDPLSAGGRLIGGMFDRKHHTHKLGDAVSDPHFVFAKAHMDSSVAVATNKIIDEGIHPSKIPDFIQKEIREQNQKLPGFYSDREIQILTGWGKLLSEFTLSRKGRAKQLISKGRQFYKEYKGLLGGLGGVAYGGFDMALLGFIADIGIRKAASYFKVKPNDFIRDMYPILDNSAKRIWTSTGRGLQRGARLGEYNEQEARKQQAIDQLRGGGLQ